MGEILGSKVPSRYIQHRVNSRRGIAGLSCICNYCVNINHTCFLRLVKCWSAMTSSWPSGAVVKVMACHAGGREFESPLEQNFFFFFFFFGKKIFLSSFHLQTSFFCISLLLFFLSAQFRFFYYYFFFSNRSTCNFLFKPIQT